MKPILRISRRAASTDLGLRELPEWKEELFSRCRKVAHRGFVTRLGDAVAVRRILTYFPQRALQTNKLD